MRAALRRASRFAVVLLVTWVVSPTMCFGISVEEVLEAWRARQRAFDTVRVRVVGTKSEPAGLWQLPEDMSSVRHSPPIPVPAEDHVQPIECDLLLDLKNGRFRRHHRREHFSASPGKYVYCPLDELAVYNGQLYKFHRPHHINVAKSPRPDSTGVELAIAEVATSVVFQAECIPVLYGCGIIHTQRAFDPHNLRPMLDRSHFRSEGEVDVEGHSCLVLRTKPDAADSFFEFWVDSEDPCIIRQVHTYGVGGDGKLWKTTRINYAETDAGSFPDSWTIEHSGDATDKVARYSIQVEEFGANPEVTDADFEIEPPPGTWVHDYRRPRDDRDYVVGEPGTPNLPVGEFALQEEQAQSRTWLYLGVAAVAVIVFTGTVLVRRRRGP